ncbi:unnamed protein product [Phytophthora lilii]|uniref:Unnamed protein product n=1 Tax=Phytophthora lilii TaxID=2077276 RepID=A0A9W6X2A3_9STRA|nr:unnamed protein product [Phytophthora lilii]
MQSEFARAAAALEKQVATLSRHNELLAAELAQSKRQRGDVEARAAQEVEELKRQVQTREERERALAQELAALKTLLQQEQEYWARHEQAGRQERDRLTDQLAQAKAETLQFQEQNKLLRREMKALQSRVDTAVATSNSFEQRLLVVVQEKQQAMHDVETQIGRYRKKLHEKRAQNKYLTEALVRLQERQSEDSSDSTTTRARTTPATAMSVESVNKPMEEPPQPQRRVRKRDIGLTLPEEIKAAAANVTTSGRTYKSKRLESSRTGTSPTSSSPEISPRSARSAPYKRPPSVATTTPTTSDGNSFNSSSNGSLRSMRSLRNVTGRRMSSRNSSDSDNIDVSPRTTTGLMRGTSPTGRLERELSGLRRKLDSCMADAAARW